MAEIDYVIPEDAPLSVSQEALFNISDLYKHIKSWFDFHGYDFYEKQYLDKLDKNAKNITIKWVGEKKIDDYLQMIIEVGIKFNNIVNVETKKGVTNKGKVTFKFVSFMKKDYDDKWNKNFIAQFLREIYDKFVASNQMDRKMGDLKEETYEVYNEVKSFLGLHMYKG